MKIKKFLQNNRGFVLKETTEYEGNKMTIIENISEYYQEIERSGGYSFNELLKLVTYVLCRKLYNS